MRAETEDKQSSISTTRSTTGNSGKIKVSLDLDFMNVMTKSTLLNLIGVLANFVVIGYLLYLIVTDTPNPTMAASVRCLDGLINCTCIFLAFKFSSKFYYFGCKCCHRRLRSCCKKIPKTVVRTRIAASASSVITPDGELGELTK